MLLLVSGCATPRLPGEPRPSSRINLTIVNADQTPVKTALVNFKDSPAMSWPEGDYGATPVDSTGQTSLVIYHIPPTSPPWTKEKLVRVQAPGYIPVTITLQYHQDAVTDEMVVLVPQAPEDQ
jgi:hypothetical protein